MAQRPSRLTVGMLSSLKDKIRYIDRMLLEKSSPGRNVTGHNFTKRKHSLRQKCRPRQYITRPLTLKNRQLHYNVMPPFPPQGTYDVSPLTIVWQITSVSFTNVHADNVNAFKIMMTMTY
jgi:hypothetical protein